MSLNVIPLTGSIGAVVGGVDLNKPVDKETFEHLHKAFLQHCVLVFRDQGIGPEAQTAFGKLWGEPAQQGNPLLKDLFVTPEIIKITKIPKETASTEAWHYDSCYTPVPPKISILAAVTVPRGGDTMWCNQYEAYDRLSPTMQRMIQGLRVKFVGLRLARMMGADDKELPTAIHPLVRTHPETGRKALYVGHPETAQQIEGMTKEESRPRTCRGADDSRACRASPSECAGSVETTSVRAPPRASSSGAAAAQVVFPTPPLPA